MQAKIMMILPIVFTFFFASSVRTGAVLVREQPAVDRSAVGDHAPHRGRREVI